MNRFTNSAVGTGLFALTITLLGASPAHAVQTPQPAPAPVRAKPAPQPAPQSVSQTEADRAKAAERAKQEERIKREREEAAAKERAEKAKTPVPVTGVKTAPALTNEQRETMKKAAHFEHVHRVRTARINRLIRIYKAKGDEAKVKKLEDMKAKEAIRTEHAMTGYRKALGEEHWNRLNAEMKREHKRGELDKGKAPAPAGGAR